MESYLQCTGGGCYVEHVKPGSPKKSAIENLFADLTKAKTIVVIGGGGGKNSVAPLFYAPVLGAMQKANPGKLEVVSVDTCYENPNLAQARRAEQAKLFRRAKFEYKQELSPEGLRDALARGNIDPSAIVLAVPVNFHLPLLKEFLQKTKAPVMVEKPITLPTEEVDAAVELHKQHPGRIYAADFALGSSSLDYFIKAGLQAHLGNILSVTGRFVEEQDLADLAKAIESRGLLRKKISGAGLGYDMGVHTLASVERILSRVLDDQSLKFSTINNVFLGAPDHPDINNHRDHNLETYWHTQAQLNSGIDLAFDAGKGLDDHNYILQIHGEKGTVVISTGTLRHKPFVFIIPKRGDKKLFTFPKDVGYKKIFEALLHMSEGKAKGIVDPSPDACLGATTASVDFVRRSYQEAAKRGITVEPITYGKTPDIASSFAAPNYLSFRALGHLSPLVECTHTHH